MSPAEHWCWWWSPLWKFFKKNWATEVSVWWVWSQIGFNGIRKVLRSNKQLQAKLQNSHFSRSYQTKIDHRYRCETTVTANWRKCITLHVISCYTMLYYVIPCFVNVIPCYIMTRKCYTEVFHMITQAQTSNNCFYEI